MPALILFASKHGCTENCARRLQEKLTGGAEVMPLKKAGPAQLAAADTVVIGGSIHAGRIQPSVRTFVKKHLELLLGKKTGLFICCMEEGEKAEAQLRQAFPEELREHAAAAAVFGGAFRFERMNFVERVIIKKISGVEKSVEKIDEEAITGFANALQA